MKLHPLIKYTSAITVLALSLSAAPLYAKGEHKGHGQLRHLFKQLELTEQQRQDVRLVLQQGKSEAAPDKGDLRQTREQLKVLIEANEFDEEAVAAVVEQQLEQSAAKKWQRALVHQQLWTLLTDEQQQRWLQTDLSETHKARKGRKDGNKKHLAKRLNLTSEQSLAIDALKQAQQQKMLEHKQSKQAFKQAELTLISEGTLTEATWNNLYEQHQSANKTAMIEVAKFRQQMWVLLTPEQQQRFAKIQDKMERKHKAKKS